jgi:5-(carboxyamino)imidazole ribonucleotide mutase
VATVALNGAKNAGILAAQIIGASDPQVAEKLDAFKASLAQKVLDAVEKLHQKGWQ